MKSNRIILLLFLLPLIALWGCEGDPGPAGPAGSDGATGSDGAAGIDGNYACLACHSTAAQDAITIQYSRSQHALGEFVDYAGARSSCAKCHSAEGFVEFSETGDVDGNFNRPSPIGCAACHNVHETFGIGDFALRTIAPVALIGDAGIGDYIVDFGNESNLCANCHQSRRGEPLATNPGETTFEITSSHYGPHHGAQANVVEGVLFAEIAGSTAYPTSKRHGNASCISCHMATYADGEGGHTWNPTLAVCNSCHGATDTTFDHGGGQTEVQGLLDDLQALLLDQGVIHWVEEDEAYEPVEAVHTMNQARAFFNWVGLSEDRSKGAHNPGYVNALLMNSIEAITPDPVQ